MVSNAIYLWWLKEDWVETSRATSRRSVGVVGGAYQWLRLNGRSGERLRLSGRFEEETRVAAHGRVLPHDKWNPAVSSRPQTDVTRLRKVTLNAVVTGRRPKEGEHLRSSSEL